MYLFDKPKERSLLNAAICYLLIIVLFGLFALFLLGPTPPGTEPIGAPVFLLSTFSLAHLTLRLHEQAQQWRHPRVAKRCR